MTECRKEIMGVLFLGGFLVVQAAFGAGFSKGTYTIRPIRYELYSRPRLMPRDGQDMVQQKLETVARNEGLSQALMMLQFHGYSTGYLKSGAHTDNPVVTFQIPGYSLDFRYQVNILRSRYVPKRVAGKRERLRRCCICWDQVASKGKPGLRAYEMKLNGRRWFIQTPPFPYTWGHAVLVQREHGRRMAVRRETIEDGIAYLNLDPEATFCSNSSYYWSSASVSDHHHYQIVRERIVGGGVLPILSARPERRGTVRGGGVSKSILHYPMPVVRLMSRSPKELIEQSWGIIRRWEALKPGRNSVNLFMKKAGRCYKVWVLFRSTDFRNPACLKKLKSETLGYLEVGGEFILPIVKDKGMLQRLANNPGELFGKMLAAINPLSGKEKEVLLPLMKHPVPTAEEAQILRRMDEFMVQIKPGDEFPYSFVRQRARRL